MKNITISRNLLYLAVLILFTSCSKLQGTVDPVTTTPNHSSTSDSYLPVTKGTYWRYAYTKDGVTDTATVTMTGLKTMYANVIYCEAATSFKLNNFPNITTYLAENDHAYKALSIAKSDTINLYFFNDTTALNNVWMASVNNSGIINGQPARYVGDIVEQNISLTIEGKSYSGITHSKIYLQYNTGDNNYTTAETYDFFMVKGIGPVEIFTSTSSGSTSSQALLDYSIK